MSVISIVKLPHLECSDPRLPALAEKVRLKRLESLQTDPESFITRYEDEIDKPLEFTQERLLNDAATHFFAIRAEVAYGSNTDVLSFILTNDLVAFVVLIDSLSTNQIATQGRTRTIAPGSATTCKYIMSATWVEKSLRGQGVGRKLIQEMIEHMREMDRKSKSHSRCETGARHGNSRALSLYQSLGFEIVEHDLVEEKNGRVFHCWGMQLQL